MKTRKILINADYGGFGLTDKAIETYLNKKNLPFTTAKKSSAISDRRLIYYVNGEYFIEYDLQRDDPILIKTVEELGCENASDKFAALKIIEIPIDVEWEIHEYDGREWVAEKHRTWL